MSSVCGRSGDPGTIRAGVPLGIGRLGLTATRSGEPAVKRGGLREANVVWPEGVAGWGSGKVIGWRVGVMLGRMGDPGLG